MLNHAHQMKNQCIEAIKQHAVLLSRAQCTLYQTSHLSIFATPYQICHQLEKKENSQFVGLTSLREKYNRKKLETLTVKQINKSTFYFTISFFHIRYNSSCCMRQGLNRYICTYIPKPKSSEFIFCSKFICSIDLRMNLIGPISEVMTSAAPFFTLFCYILLQCLKTIYPKRQRTGKTIKKTFCQINITGTDTICY